MTLSRGAEKKRKRGKVQRRIKMRLRTKSTEPTKISTSARSTFVDISQPVIAFRSARTRITGGRNGPHEISFPYLILAASRNKEEKKERQREGERKGFSPNRERNRGRNDAMRRGQKGKLCRAVILIT